MPDQMLFKPELMDAIPDGIVVVDHSGEIVSANQAAATLFGYPLDTLVGLRVEQLVPDDLRPGHEQTREGFTAHPSRRLMGSGLQLKALRADGTTVDVEISLSPVETDGSKIVIASVRDITERLSLEQRLIQTQRLESLGLLSAGVAHDFNNLLMPILGYANIATQELPPESPALPRLQQIEIAARAAADLVSNLMAYAGQADIERGAVDLSGLIEAMAGILETTMSPRAILSYQFADNLPMIEGDISQLRQVVLNLITNASDAVGERSGRITIRTAVLHADRQYLKATYVDDDLPAGTYVAIEVADTGVGMASTTAARMFDPFFTTKGDGRGLGMASVLGIVRAHRGAVKVYTEPGEGTSVKLLFPVAESIVAPPVVSATVGGATPATVLVVDDDESVRTVTVDMLEIVGWNVISAADGAAAIQALADHREEVGVVLLDYMMPGMRSADVVTELKRLEPEIPIILTSGYAESEATATFPGKGLAGFLQKPYTITVLSEVVNKALTPTE